VSAQHGTLASIVARKHAEAETLRCAAATLWSKAEAIAPARGFDALRGGTVIAEMKRRSPSGGELRPDLDPDATAKAFVGAGAAALSVLTDGPDFGGSLDDLASVRAAVDVPILRKDFIVDPIQIAEARIAGADWVLFIVALLDDALLEACLEAAGRSGAHAIVEVHDAAEARRAADAGADCIGINNRNLRTLTTDVGTFERVRQSVPASTVCIAESGIRDAAGAAAMIGAGADAVLVGEALMRAESPAALCAEIVSAVGAAAMGRS
jgi:indole-3-glycerol phosphate synthase